MADRATRAAWRRAALYLALPDLDRRIAIRANPAPADPQAPAQPPTCPQPRPLAPARPRRPRERRDAA